MCIFEQSQPQPTPLPGIRHATWAGAAEGLSQLSLWRQSIAPGSGTPPHLHDCDEVVLCLGGHGELHVDGTVQSFGSNATLVLPRRALHQIVNTGAVPLEILGILGATPVVTRLPDERTIDLPWRS